MRIRQVAYPHYICSGNSSESLINKEVPPHPRMSDGGRRFWNRIGLFSCDEAVIATDNGQVVGFFRYFTHNPNITTAGTWIDPAYRGKGLAHKLWSKALDKPWIKKVFYITASQGGKALIRSLKKRHPHLKFRSNY